MEDLISLFGHNNILLFSEADHMPGKVIRIVVKNHYIDGKKENTRGIKYYILGDKYEIKSDIMSQSWDALSVWFKLFKKQEVVGKYNFENNSVTLNNNNG
jgi:hypothetical protein